MVQIDTIRSQSNETSVHLRSHPIAGCPVDVLQLVFESAVEICPGDFHISDFSFRAATTISHVCHHWRTIALKTPRLWTNLHCSVSGSQSPLQAFWRLVIERVKLCPVDISLSDISEDSVEGRGPMLRDCRVDEIPVIRRLELNVVEAEDFRLLVGPHFRPPKKMIEELRISATHRGKFHTAVVWQMTQLLERFPPISQLSVSIAPHISFKGPSKAVENTTTLELCHVAVFNPSTLLIRFPRLQQLIIREVDTVELQRQEFGGIHLKYLKNLTLYHVPSIDWLSRLTCPPLRQLEIHSCQGIDHIIPFLSNHPSITSFAYTAFRPSHRIISIAELGVAAANLEDAIFWLQDIDITELYSRHFPNLKSLTLHDTKKELTLEGFENLVEHRCLPAEHGRSQIGLGTSTLELTIGTGNSVGSVDKRKDACDAGVEWMASRYVTQAKSYVRESVGRAWEKRTMKWVD